MKIGFIGLGNMATAMIEGIIRSGIVSASDISGSAKTEATRQRIAEKSGILTTADNGEVAAGADLLFLAVKPNLFSDIIGEIAGKVREHTVIISIAAGKTMEWIECEFAHDIKLIRCMPNTPALVGEGCTGVCRNGRVSDMELEQAMRLFKTFGIASEVPEKLMDAVIGVSGSSPAYVFLFIEAMADGAVAAGMSRKQAYEMAAQAVLGSAKMVLETGKHPGELKDMVCSPGGTTIEAVKVLEEKGFRAAVMEAMEACIEKSKRL